MKKNVLIRVYLIILILFFGVGCAKKETPVKTVEYINEMPIKEVFKSKDPVLKISLSKENDRIYAVTKNNVSNKIHIIDINTKTELKEIPIPKQFADNTLSLKNGTLSLLEGFFWLTTKLSFFEKDLITMEANEYQNDIRFNYNIWGYDRSPINHHSAIIDSTGFIYLWDLHNSRLLWTSDSKISRPDSDNKAFIKFSADGKIIAASAQIESKILIVDAKTGASIASISKPKGTISSFALSKDNKTIVYALKNSSIIQADINKPQSQRSFKIKMIIEHIHLSDDNKYIITADSTGVVTIFELLTGSVISSFQANRGWTISMAIADDYSFGVSSGPESEINVWPLPSQLKQRLEY